MLIMILFHDSGYRCFKHFHLKKVCKQLRHLFPKKPCINVQRTIDTQLALFWIRRTHVKIMLRKRYIIECINELLKNKANLVHSRHRSIHNFIMNLCSVLTAYCFFDNKPEALPVYVEKSKQLELFAYWTYPELR